jgi:hypothetical protein
LWWDEVRQSFGLAALDGPIVYRKGLEMDKNGRLGIEKNQRFEK